MGRRKKMLSNKILKFGSGSGRGSGGGVSMQGDAVNKVSHSCRNVILSFLDSRVQVGLYMEIAGL